MNKDPKLLAMAGVATTLDNVDNVKKLVEYVDQYKEKMSQMKETIRKERGEGKNLKRKHDIFSQSCRNSKKHIKFWNQTKKY